MFVMKRSELEAKLKALGWAPTGPSGANHVAWKHPRRTITIYVRQADLIDLAIAEAILAQAEE